MRVIINLENSEADLLCEILQMYDDCGPHGESYQSEKLIDLSNKVCEAVKESKG